MTPYYQHNGITIYCGDCREILPGLSGGDWFCFTDPPYNVGKDYDGWNDNLPDSEYLAFTAFWIGEIKRLCGEICVYAPNKYYLDYWCLLGRDFQQIILTWSTNTGALRGGWIKQKAGLLTNATPKSNCSDWWHNTQARRMGYFFKEDSFDHPGFTSEDLTAKVLMLLSDPAAAVIDPFAGTGTTMRIAKNLGRRAIGIEQSERYCEIAALRLQQAIMFEAEPVASPEPMQASLWRAGA